LTETGFARPETESSCLELLGLIASQYSRHHILAGVCAGVCWLGDEPGLVSRRLHLTSTGAANLDDHLHHHWELGFTRRKAEDLYAQAATWMASDISANELARLG
jgi:hypothetical protein